MTRRAVPADSAELEQLRAENQRLQELNHKAFDYIRAKVNDLLDVVGTRGTTDHGWTSGRSMTTR